MAHKGYHVSQVLYKAAFCASLLCATAACEKEHVIAKQGEPCHVSKDGWRSCEAELLCLSPTDQERLGESKVPSGDAVITQVSGHIDDQPELYESDGLFGGRKLLKGACFARAALGQPCASNEMCKEGVCMQSAGETEGTIVNKCAVPPEP